MAQKSCFLCAGACLRCHPARQDRGRAAAPSRAFRNPSGHAFLNISLAYTYMVFPLIEKCWIALSRPVSAQDRLHGPPISLLLLSVRRLLPEPSCRFFMILKQVLSAWYDKQRKLFAVNPLWSLSTSRSVSSSSAAGIVSSSSTFSATSSLEPVAQAYHVCGVHKCRRSLYRPSLASTAPSASCACRELHSLAREANALNETGCLVKDTHKQSLSKSLA